jgi:hypothetical protein
MNEDLKFKIKSYLMIGSMIYGLLMIFSFIFRIGEDFIFWTFTAIIILSSLWGIYYYLQKIIKRTESDRFSNKRNIIHQYFFIVPKRIIFYTLYTIPFIFITTLFYVIGKYSSFYNSFCLPLLGGVIGEVIWGLLFFSTFCFLVYKIYEQLNRRFLD